MPVEKSEEGDEFHVLTDSGAYTEHHYKNEKELEELVVAHADEVFGKNTLYVDVKQKDCGQVPSQDHGWVASRL
jgi:hypothetical protein